LKYHETGNRNRCDAEGDLVGDGEQPELIKCGLQREQPEIRDRIGVDQNPGENEDRTEREQAVNTEERQGDVRHCFEDSCDHESPEDRSDLLSVLRAFVLSIFPVENNRTVEEKEINICDEDVCQWSEIDHEPAVVE
jgi:hypothetical protein